MVDEMPRVQVLAIQTPDRQQELADLELQARRQRGGLGEGLLDLDAAGREHGDAREVEVRIDVRRARPLQALQRQARTQGVVATGLAGRSAREPRAGQVEDQRLLQERTPARRGTGTLLGAGTRRDQQPRQGQQQARANQGRKTHEGLAGGARRVCPGGPTQRPPR
ncbi:MAG: hypothetical protein EXR79_08820 [Myxococcales bacterium]|nr:hypothetical protein [Myxococcales bacterium]